MNYNGDRSTNLIGRDLMTPEEVKQLHYKTIIFPIIGFPIFRDTILYNKFSCYQEGMVERNINFIKDLSNTYFTVEDIKYKIKRNRDNQEQLPKEFLEELEVSDKEKLEEVKIIINKIFKSDYDIKYNITSNHRTYLTISINRELRQKEKNLLSTRVKKELYYTEIKESHNKTIINIYNENPVMNLNMKKGM